jgi:hypothetical protein
MMGDIPVNITRDHMVWAIKQIDSGEYTVEEPHRSRSYCIEYLEGRKFRHFPPKEVITLANVLPNKELFRKFYGGKEANSFCERRGFKIVKDCGGAPHK